MAFFEDPDGRPLALMCQVKVPGEESGEKKPG